MEIFQKKFDEVESQVTDGMFENVVANALVGISGKRAEHILAVRDEAVFMARRLFPFFGMSAECERDVECMALLHDVTKEKDLDEQIRLCEENGFVLTNDDLANPQVIHSVSGAAAAKKFFGMPERITDAILKHTTGSGQMSLFDKILFLADFTEPTRKYESCQKVREVFHRGTDEIKTREDADVLVDKCVCMAALETVSHLAKAGKRIHPVTVHTVESICAQHVNGKQSDVFRQIYSELKDAVGE